MTAQGSIRVTGARQHNLAGFDLELPHGQLVVVTGVSGSGKSSLAFDTLFREGQRRFLESLSSHARQLLGKLDRPAVDRIEGLPPALAVDQHAVVRSPRSTVGTLTELYHHLRLLFARTADPPVSSSLLSFNTPQGACSACKGLGVEDRVDPELLIADSARTLREGALVPTTPNGYIVYSQVTVDVLDRVCAEHGFSVDVPWCELTDEQQRVVLNGSDRIEIPFGKHPLENRMKWSGITARPRQEGYYRGIVPVIEEILARSRNRNALRFARTVRCHACEGSRLGPEALALEVGGRSIADWAAQPLRDTSGQLSRLGWPSSQARRAEPVVAAFVARAALVDELGLGHLTLDRPSPTLSAGEVQRLRLATQVGTHLRGLLYVLDEPSIGLHARDMGQLLGVLRRLRDAGNTVVVVEHDPATMRAADLLVDVGPGAGDEGGELVYVGPPAALATAAATSATAAALSGVDGATTRVARPGAGELWVRGAAAHNLRDLDAPLLLGALNVVTGVSGAGKTTLVHTTVGRALRARLHGAQDLPGAHRGIEGADAVDKVIAVDQSPIGRTPRSNPATYTKVFDAIRALFAAEPDARARGWGKGHFSLNTRGGRCEVCSGAGVETVGMHFLGDVAVTCTACGGRRFDEPTLDVRYRGHSVLDVLGMSAARAAELFADQPKIRRVLDALVDVGLGYLPLGRPSTTLSGGEAQRVKLARELGRPSTGRTLLLLDEPTRGLHAADVHVLLTALQRLVERGNTVVVIEHDLTVIRAADRVLDLGPGSGPDGGRLVAVGTPDEVAAIPASATGAALRGDLEPGGALAPAGSAAPFIELRGVRTHNLRGLDVRIPLHRLTVVTGLSGSGKSSLAIDTLAEVCRARFVEGLPAFVRRRLDRPGEARLADADGLTPALAIGQRPPAHNPRSTVATMTEVHEALRLLFARAGQRPGGGEGGLLAAQFSFNDHRGACEGCRGLGAVTTCDPDRLITHPERSVLDGAMDGTKTGRYYGERDGRFVAHLRAVGADLGFDYDQPWGEQPARAREVALSGAGDTEYEVRWHYRRGKREGTHEFQGRWEGLVALVDDEYQRKHADHRGDAMRGLMKDVPCPECGGARLGSLGRSVTFAGQTLVELERRSADDLQAWVAGVRGDAGDLDARARAVADPLLEDVDRRLGALCDLGLGYLPLDRASPSLSGGEFQRTRLATQLSSRMCGVTYVLDEPTVGLHARDTHRLLSVLRRLRDEGNTVVVVEHDLTVIRAADHVIDLGPGAGAAGGEIVVQGTPGELAAHPASLTASWLRGERGAGGGEMARELRPGLQVRGASARNLRCIDLDLPAGGLVAISGVSGAGKSALLFDVVAASLEAGRPVECEALLGGEGFDRVVAVDQAPLPGAARNMPITLCGAFDPLRALFAATDEARARRWTKRHFALVGKGGRCEACSGTGWERVEMGFLPDVRLECEVCGGRRYDAEALQIRVDGRSIADVLALTVEQAVEALISHPRVARKLAPLVEVGLGYLRLGQSVDTLSGGESQRLKLAGGLSAARGTQRLYLLDEPTCGLHSEDVLGLLDVFHRLVDGGHTVVVIEHDLTVLRAADWLVDLGPEGGTGGGTVMASGQPAIIAETVGSNTGEVLRDGTEMPGVV